jgi:hypothetical protein
MQAIIGRNEAFERRYRDQPKRKLIGVMHIEVGQRAAEPGQRMGGDLAAPSREPGCDVRYTDGQRCGDEDPEDGARSWWKDGARLHGRALIHVEQGHDGGRREIYMAQRGSRLVHHFPECREKRCLRASLANTPVCAPPHGMQVATRTLSACIVRKKPALLASLPREMQTASTQAAIPTAERSSFGRKIRAELLLVESPKRWKETSAVGKTSLSNCYVL